MRPTGWLKPVRFGGEILSFGGELARLPPLKKAAHNLGTGIVVPKDLEGARAGKGHPARAPLAQSHAVSVPSAFENQSAVGNLRVELQAGHARGRQQTPHFDGRQGIVFVAVANCEVWFPNLFDWAGPADGREIAERSLAAGKVPPKGTRCFP